MEADVAQPAERPEQERGCEPIQEDRYSTLVDVGDIISSSTVHMYQENSEEVDDSDGAVAYEQFGRVVAVDCDPPVVTVVGELGQDEDRHEDECHERVGHDRSDVFQGFPSFVWCPILLDVGDNRPHPVYGHILLVFCVLCQCLRG